MQKTIRIICSLNWKIYLYLVQNIERTLKAQEVLSKKKTKNRFKTLGVLAFENKQTCKKYKGPRGSCIRKPRSISLLNFLVPRSITGGPAYYVLHPQKGVTICRFLTYQAFKNREGIISRNHSYWGITDVGILNPQNNLWTNSLIRVQFIHFFLLLLVSYFDEMVICFNIW